MSINYLTDTVVCVSPNNFGFNFQTAQSNPFQQQIGSSEGDIQEKALDEFNNAVSELRKNKINVLVLPSREDVITPDSIFPNNWFSHHSDGKLIIYPMLAQNRREERQPEALEKLLKENGVLVSEIIDLTADENSENFLEGTGSLVLDRKNKVVFAMESVRTKKQEFDKWCKLMEYTGVFFDAYDKDGFPIYHTNVTMSVGSEYAVICLESIKDLSERKLVEDKLKELGKDIIELSAEQIYQYCGNTLQVISKDGTPKIVMSKTAYIGFSKNQLIKLQKYGEIVQLDIPTIEKVGGGSARCMLAEVFLQDG